MTLHNAESYTGFNIALKREGEKEKRRKEEVYITT